MSGVEDHLDVWGSFRCGIRCSITVAAESLNSVEADSASNIVKIFTTVVSCRGNAKDAK
jgi:hypothetical protein